MEKTWRVRGELGYKYIYINNLIFHSLTLSPFKENLETSWRTRGEYGKKPTLQRTLPQFSNELSRPLTVIGPAGRARFSGGSLSIQGAAGDHCPAYPSASKY